MPVFFCAALRRKTWSADGAGEAGLDHASTVFKGEVYVLSKEKAAVIRRSSRYRRSSTSHDGRDGRS